MSETDKRQRKLYARKLDMDSGVVDLTHGAGGKNTCQLIDEVFIGEGSHPALCERGDYGAFALSTGERLVMSTDAHVVSPLFFPGGDIGKLAVCGTINDVAVSGAEPLYLSIAYILEEGLPLSTLRRVVESVRAAERETGVPIITGDTKVVERGKADGLFVTTTGVGRIANGGPVPHMSRVRPGDSILLSGFMGDHGVAVMSQREHLGFESAIESDCAALHGLIAALRKACPDVHFLRDPTRGGVAATLYEIAQGADVSVVLEEEAIPVRPAVRAACELLGLDPIHVANEGKVITIVGPEDEERALSALRAHPLGQHAAVIGRVGDDSRNILEMRGAYGGLRVVHWLAGEELPRIC